MTENTSSKIFIVNYNRSYKTQFKVLNEEWLNKYFTVEPEDEKILSDPDNSIISTGGEIFIAIKDDEVVGTCAAIKTDDKTYELAKMAVTEKARGLGIGKALAFAVINFVKNNNGEKIVLETNPVLKKALNLYNKLGFKVVEGQSPFKYERCLTKMELIL